VSRQKFEYETVDAMGKVHKLKVEQHPGEEGWTLFVDLVAVCSEAFGEMLDAGQRAIMKLQGDGQGQFTEADLDLALLGKGLARFALQLLRSRDGTAIFKRLFEYTLRDGKKFSSAMAGPPESTWTINQDMAGNYQEMAVIATHCLTANYSNLFAGSLPDVRALVAAFKR